MCSSIYQPSVSRSSSGATSSQSISAPLPRNALIRFLSSFVAHGASLLRRNIGLLDDQRPAVEIGADTGCEFLRRDQFGLGADGGESRLERRFGDRIGKRLVQA